MSDSLSTISAFDKVLNEVSDKDLNGYGVTTTISGMGAVYVVFGSPQGGLQSGPSLEVLPSSVPSPAGGLIALFRFGSALTAGDFDGDGLDDLVVGMPFALADAGAIAVYSGGLFPGGTVPTA